MEAHQQKHKAYGTPGVHGVSSNVIPFPPKHSFKATIMRGRVELSPLFILSFILSLGQLYVLVVLAST
jgi:hypothetical protein